MWSKIEWKADSSLMLPQSAQLPDLT